MEQKDINIYEILKGVEYGTELYTPMCGKVVFTYLSSSNGIIRTEKDSGIYCFEKNGRWREGGEVMLFPSKEMRDWAKFSWKKGDVLVSKDREVHIIFEKFEDDAFTKFRGKYYLWNECYNEEVFQMETSVFEKASDDDAQTYINNINKCFCGKLNRETLEIEKPQPEFKDGDIVVAEEDNYYDRVIFIAAIKDNIVSKALINVRYEDYEVHYNEYSFGCNRSLRLATDFEKQQLFDALAKEGKRWDSEKKQIVDLKPAFEIGKLYVFNEDDEDGELTIIGKLIDKNESEDTLTFGDQYEIENQKFVTDQTFDLRISVNKELREATDGELLMFQKARTLWKREKEEREQPAFKTFDKVLVRDGGEYEWLPALFVRDRGEGANYRYKVLSLRSGKPAEFACCIPYEGNENIIFTDHNIDDLPF